MTVTTFDPSCATISWTTVVFPEPLPPETPMTIGLLLT